MRPAFSRCCISARADRAWADGSVPPRDRQPEIFPLLRAPPPATRLASLVVAIPATAIPATASPRLAIVSAIDGWGSPMGRPRIFFRFPLLMVPPVRGLVLPSARLVSPLWPDSRPVLFVMNG